MVLAKLNQRAAKKGFPMMMGADQFVGVSGPFEARYLAFPSRKTMAAQQVSYRTWKLA